jgi:hypothetical protein
MSFFFTALFSLTSMMPLGGSLATSAPFGDFFEMSQHPVDSTAPIPDPYKDLLNDIAAIIRTELREQDLLFAEERWHLERAEERRE